MEFNSVNEKEFNKIMSEKRSVTDPAFQQLEQTLSKEKRVFVTGLTPSQKARLYYAFPGEVHVIKHGVGHLIFLDRLKNPAD